jgi:hypothetical protein
LVGSLFHRLRPYHNPRRNARKKWIFARKIRGNIMVRRKVDPRQMDLFATAETPRPTAPEMAPMPPDELGDAIIKAGLCPNDYLLSLNGVMTPYDAELADPWNLPSRMFRFPIETCEPCRDREGTYHPRRIGMRHALLARTGDQAAGRRAEHPRLFQRRDSALVARGGPCGRRAVGGLAAHPAIHH